MSKMLLRIICLMIVTTILAWAQESIGVRCWVTDPGKRAVASSKGYYDLYLVPGGAAQHVLEVSNQGTKPAIVKIYTADGLNDEAGSLFGAPSNQPPSFAGSWLKLEHTRLELAPQESRRVAFSVAVPADCPVGEQVSWVFVEPEDGAGNTEQTAKPGEGEATVGIKFKPRIGVYISTFVGPPDSRKGGWELVSSGPSAPGKKIYREGQIVYQLSLKNSGNILLKPKMAWTLTDQKGRVVSSSGSPREVGYVCPGRQITLELPLSQGKVMARGRYQIRCDLSEEKNPALSQQQLIELDLP